jgi:hypothetical protein
MTVVSAVLMWAMLLAFRAIDARRTTRERPPMARGMDQQAPPAPRLQVSDALDMERLRRAEDAALEHATWVDPRQGTVRLPVATAIDLVAAHGLPKPGAAPAALPPDPTSPPLNQPSVGTIMPAPGMGLGQVAPSAAAPMSQPGLAMAEPTPAAPAPAARRPPTAGRMPAPAAAPRPPEFVKPPAPGPGGLP